jgi:3,4-dihydroxy 2-butanone 4-phosphate synthase/GTP cyclohydrolase II
VKQFSKIIQALNDLQAGKFVIVRDDANREHEGDLIALAEFITPDMVNFAIKYGRGLLCVALDKSYAQKLNFTEMVAHNTDRFNTAFTISVDHINNGTGISAADRAETIRKIAHSKSIASDFRRPGHIFPVVAKALGVLERRGHTEATVDLAKLCNSKPVGVMCEIIADDGNMSREQTLLQFAKKFKLSIINISDIINYRQYYDKLVEKQASALLPTKFGKFKLEVYSNIIDNKELLVLTKSLNTKNNQPPLVRIHSECITGDTFHSLRCDCQQQLEQSMIAIQKYGKGCVIYLRQEGRGIGIINKIKAYALQDKGIDTVEANLQLNLPIDMREYFLAANILRQLKIKNIHLLTNNPHKIADLEYYGINIVKRIPLIIGTSHENKNYINSKKNKLKHLL